MPAWTSIPDKEALFNEVYDTEHVPALLKVPGVLSVRRAVSEPLTMFLGGEKKTIVAEGEPRYSAYLRARKRRGADERGLG